MILGVLHAFLCARESVAPAGQGAGEFGATVFDIKSDGVEGSDDVLKRMLSNHLVRSNEPIADTDTDN